MILLSKRVCWMLHALTVLGYLGKLKKGPGQSMFFACLFHINVSKRGRGKYKNLNIFRMESILVETKSNNFLWAQIW